MKVEEPSAGEIVADKVEALKSTKDQALHRMRTIDVEVRRMWAQAQALQKETGKDSQTIFISECSALEKKTIRAIKVLERWAVDGETAIETQLVKLVHLTEECDKLFDDALGWGKSSSLLLWDLDRQLLRAVSAARLRSRVDRCALRRFSGTPSVDA